MEKYYDGTKLLSLKDINGQTPEIYIATSNRTAGKSCWFGRYFINRFKKYKEEFILLYRFDYELDECATKFFGDINQLFFPEDYMTSRKVSKGVYTELLLNDVICGYAISLNKADQIKKCSHVFNRVKRILFDEFQSETGHYCTNEIEKFVSIHTSVARGNGEQVRHVPVFLVGNPITLLNPYYTELGISNVITNDTKFLRGNGYVLEQGYNESAKEAQSESGFNKAFNRNKYVAYSSQGVYLNDNKSFIEKVDGKCRYLATIKYNGCEYAIREYAQKGIVYCDDKPDITFPTKLSITTDDHEINYVMLKSNSLIITVVKYYFDRGCFRFKNLKCKEAILKMLSY